MKLLALLKAKGLITIVAGFLLVGGATAAFAATSAGQTVVQSIAHAHVTVTPHTPGDQHDQGSATPQKGQGKPACAGLSDAQNLAKNAQLSTASSGSAVQDICAL